LSGGATAAPMWADFMMKATLLPGYRDVKAFDKPEGVDSVMIDSDTLQVATPSCPVIREEVYIAGSEPTQLCELHGGHGPATAVGSFLSHIFGGGPPKPPQEVNGTTGQIDAQNGQGNGEQNGAQPAKVAEKKKGPLAKIFGIFGGKKKDPDKQQQNRDKGDSP
jgi:penicillin-binding protein 1B